MSRIVKKIVVPSNVVLNYENDLLKVEGPKGAMSLKLHELLDVVIKDTTLGKELLVVEKGEGLLRNKSLLGTFTILIKNIFQGVVSNHEKKLKLVGVGYKVVLDKDNLILHLGFSHTVLYKIPVGVVVKVLDSNEILVSGVCKHQVGQVSAEIRSKRPPELYKGKGIRYLNEVIILKEGKKK